MFRFDNLLTTPKIFCECFLWWDVWGHFLCMLRCTLHGRLDIARSMGESPETTHQCCWRYLVLIFLVHFYTTGMGLGHLHFPRNHQTFGDGCSRSLAKSMEQIQTKTPVGLFQMVTVRVNSPNIKLRDARNQSSESEQFFWKAIYFPTRCCSSVAFGHFFLTKQAMPKHKYW